MRVIVLVFPGVSPALRALAVPPLPVPRSVPPALTNACTACAGVPAGPTGVVAEMAASGSIRAVYPPLCSAPLARSVEVSWLIWETGIGSFWVRADRAWQWGGGVGQ